MVFIRELPVQVVLWINGGDCTEGDGNTAEELEAIAVGLLRAAQVVRKQDFGAIEVTDRLLRARITPDKPEYDELEPPILEEFRAVDVGLEFRQMAHRLIDCYRRAQAGK